MTSPGLAPPPLEVLRPASAPVVVIARGRPVISLPRFGARVRHERWPLLVSLGVHAAGLAALALVLSVGPQVVRTPPPVESVEYVDLEWPVSDAGEGAGAAAEPVTAPGSAVAADAPARRSDAAPLVFPGRVPQGITAAGGSSAVGSAETGTPAGEGAGSGAVGERLRPGFRDSRLYVSPDALPRNEKSNHQKYMEHLDARIEASNDSARMAARVPDTDWTFKDREGRKWGLSEKGVHLGGVTVPKELVPRPRATGTNQDLEEAREEQRQRDEIRRQEDERERRQAREKSIRATRERRDAEREKAKEKAR